MTQLYAKNLIKNKISKLYTYTIIFNKIKKEILSFLVYYNQKNKFINLFILFYLFFNYIKIQSNLLHLLKNDIKPIQLLNIFYKQLNVITRVKYKK